MRGNFFRLRGRGYWIVALGLILSACTAPAGKTAAPDTLAALLGTQQTQSLISTTPDERHWDTLLAEQELIPLLLSIQHYTASHHDLVAPRWLVARIDEGHGSAALPITLAKLFARPARHPAGKSGTWEVHDLIAWQWLTYARIVAFVDAPSCADRSASEDKLSNLMRNFAEIDAAGRAQPPEQLQGPLDAAMALEARTWPTRLKEPSRWLCSGGMAEMAHSLAAGGHTRTTAATGGSHYGRQIEVARDPAWRPAFSDPASWVPTHETRRSNARALMLRWAQLGKKAPR
jgi:hypothetical protein